MKAINNFAKRINADRHNRFAVAGVDGSWAMHVDTDGWLWIEPSKSTSVTHCMRIEFQWEKNQARVHIIPLGKGTRFTHESFIHIQLENFRTFDVFKDWICSNILNRKSYLTAL